MPKHAQYCLHWEPVLEQYHFTDLENQSNHFLATDGSDWQTWLEEHHAFAFHGRSGHINLLKEQRSPGQKGYWYAYQRHQGRVRKLYVGQNVHVNLEQLEIIAARLSGEVEPASSSTEHSSMPQKKHKQDSQPISRPANHVQEPARDPATSTTLTENAVDTLFDESLLLPKLQLPHLQPSLLPREHLLNMLDTGLEYKITLIAGPAGYGKTALLGQWIATRRGDADFPRVVCLTLDDGDNDPLRFWRYLIAACEQFSPGLGKDALALLHAHRLPSWKPLNTMLIALLNALSHLAHPCILLLDNLHVLNSPQVKKTFSFFLEHIPSSFHLFLLTRGSFPFSEARLHARNELWEISPRALRFSVAETQTFFEQQLPFSLSTKIIHQIDERLEGWPAGLRLFAATLLDVHSEQEIEDRLHAFSGRHLIIQDYFLHNILQSRSSAEQTFLFQTSFLPRVHASLCDAITLRNDSAQLLNILHENDLFLIPLDWEGEWTRYYPLFAEALQQEARRRLGDAQVQELATRASIWYETHNLWQEAIETAFHAIAFPRAAQLISHFLELQQPGNAPAIPERYRIKHWLECLPQEELECHPNLCLSLALIILFVLIEDSLFTEGNQRIAHLLQVAEGHWRDTNSTAKLAEVFAFRALLARLDGNILQAVTWARQALSWLPEQSLVWRNLALTTIGIGELFDGTLAQAHKSLLEALRLNEEQRDLIQMRATKGRLSRIRFEQGELRQAAEQLRQVQTEARSVSDLDDLMRTEFGLAQIAYQWNALEDAEQAANNVLSMSEGVNKEGTQTRALVLLARIAHARGQSALAEEHLTAWLVREQVLISPRMHRLSQEVHAQLARIQLDTGELHPVIRWFESRKEDKTFLSLYQRRCEQLLYARLLLAQEANTEAIQQLEDLCADALRTGHIHFRLEAQAVLVRAFSLQGADKKARELLRELLETSWREGYIRLFLDEGEEMANLLQELLPQLRKQALIASVQHILSAFAPQGSSQSSIETILPLVPLSLQEQKVLRRLATGDANGEIARALVVSVNTVRTQVQSIYRKLNVNNRIQACIVARQLDLL